MPPVTRALIEARLAGAREQESRAMATMNACAGAIQAYEALLADLETDDATAPAGAAGEAEP